MIRDLVEREAKERQKAVTDIEESLNRDLGEIRERLEEENKLREDKIEEIHSEFIGEYERMQS